MAVAAKFILKEVSIKNLVLAVVAATDYSLDYKRYRHVCNGK